MPSIRRAHDEDAKVLAGFADHAFRSAYAAKNDPADTESYLRNAFSVHRVRSEIADSDNTFLLAIIETEMMGYAKLRVGTPPPEVRGPMPIELERLYAAPRAIGRGVGSALMEACLDTAAAGHGTLWLGVWTQNPRAIHFYEKWGFEVVGKRVFTLGADPQDDLVMERPVTGPRATPAGP